VTVAQEPVKAASDASATKVRRLNPIKLRQMQERCSFVEEEIPRLESSIAAAEESLGVYESAEETQRVTQLLQTLREQHGSLNAEWEELVQQLEQQAIE
jgi:ATP-binding cassette, subfamily F, member 3